MHFTLPDRRPFAFPGLWSTWKSPDGERIGSCTIITGPANRVGRAIHDRMPVVLPDRGGARGVARPGARRRRRRPAARPAAGRADRVQQASKRVNAATYDAPDCLDEDEDPTEETQLTLAI